MKTTVFWHGRRINQFSNDFEYWRGWVSYQAGRWRVYYQYGKIAYSPATSPPGGSSFLGYLPQSSELAAEGSLQRKALRKIAMGYAGKWYHGGGLLVLDFPLGIPHRDWQLSLPSGAEKSGVASLCPGEPLPDDTPSERRSSCDIGWRLDPL